LRDTNNPTAHQRPQLRSHVLWVLAAACTVALVASCASTSTTTKAAGPSASSRSQRTSSSVETSAADAPDRGATLVSAAKQPGVQHLTFKYGPIAIQPGQNNIAFSGTDVPKPKVDGYILAVYPNLVQSTGVVPRVDVVHLHHGVWVNLGSGGGRGAKRGGPKRPGAKPASGSAASDVGDRGAFGRELFFASGEEKTTMILPKGYGYEYKASDKWLINYMLHNLLPSTDKVWITYDMDFIPAGAPGAKDIKPARPVWMDVEKGQIYPVFDVLKGSGKNGKYTFPDDATNPYGTGKKLNTWTVDKDSVLLATAGHLHPGGTHTDMFVTRNNKKSHIFQSKAIYYEPAGPVSWDVTMTATPPDWRVAVKKGDVISISATYDTTRASWYESMGIMVLWMTDGADGTKGSDALKPGVDKVKEYITHGHLPENRNHGGGKTKDFVDATKLPSGPATSKVNIVDFTYSPGDINGIFNTVPTVKAGQSLEFYNKDTNATKNEVWHTITACAAPCDKATGVAYPLADAKVPFDSGELGVKGPPTAGRVDWQVPKDLPAGTYTYFCRIHPFMRGAFRVTK
jgi:plastocyanin